jgi:uncharacterized protein (DUF1786 family)
MPTDWAVDNLITEAMTAAIRAERNGVEMYDYAMAEIENDLAHVVVSYSFVVASANERHAIELNYSSALRRLRNLREVFLSDECEYMLRAPLKQGYIKDGVIE